MTTPHRFTREGFIQAQEAIAKAAEEKAAQRQHAKQKLTARERLALFFDDGVWHEVGQFIGGSVLVVSVRPWPPGTAAFRDAWSPPMRRISLCWAGPSARSRATRSST